MAARNKTMKPRTFDSKGLQSIEFKISQLGHMAEDLYARDTKGAETDEEMVYYGIMTYCELWLSELEELKKVKTFYTVKTVNGTTGISEV